jgi:hypothetical protein
MVDSLSVATPFFATLAQQGLLDHPLFGFDLTTNASGMLTIGMGHMVTNLNASLMMMIKRSNIAEFSPFSTKSNVPSYLQWAIAITSEFVLVFASVCHAHIITGKWNPDHTHTNICELHAQFFASIILF